MKKLYMGQKMIVSALAGMILIPGSVVRIQAAENEEQQSVVPTAGIESALEECYRTKVKENLQLYLVPTDEGEYLNIAFSDTDDFTYVRSEPDENSDWTGKLYKDSTVEVLEYLDGWTKIRSGETEGYVPTEKLFTGEDARIHSGEYEENTATVTADRLNVRAGTGTDTEVLTQVSEGETYEIRGEQADGWYPVKVGEINGWVYGAYVTTETSYSYGETKEQEEARIAAEEEQKTREAAAAALVSKGQSVVDYAYQFLGNPYVWGGTSLTNGADCSGFVQSVYAHFGISLPRTSYEQRTAGDEISYAEAQPGDLILYEGHVGIYMGDGKIINAMNEAQGIGVCSATYTNIVAVRRVL